MIKPIPYNQTAYDLFHSLSGPAKDIFQTAHDQAWREYLTEFKSSRWYNEQEGMIFALIRGRKAVAKYQANPNF